jgi:hypothetical protein
VKLERNSLIERRTFVLLSIFLGAYVFLFCWIGRYAFPSADDFFYATDIFSANGLWAFLGEVYLSWSGRLTCIFFWYISYSLGMEKLYPFLASFNSLLNLTVIFLLLRAILKNESKRKLLFLSLLFQAVWLALVPGLNENFYWLNASFYTWSAALALLSIAMSVQALSGRRGRVFFAALLALVFFNGMMIETMTVTQVGVAFVFMVYFLWRKQYRSAKLTAFILAAALCALLETVTAPGNLLRQSAAKQVTPSGEFLQTLAVAGAFGCLTALKFLASPTAWVLLLYMPTIAKKIPSFDAKLSALLRVKYIVLLVVLVAVGNQAVNGFAMGTPLSPRGEGLAVWVMTVTWLFLWLFVYRNERLFAKIEKLKIYPWLNVILVVCLVFNPNFISLARDTSVAPLYAQEMRERYASTERQKREGKKEIFLPSLRHKPKLVFYRDLELFPKGGSYNENYSAYWGVGATVCYPYALETDSDGTFTSLEEVLDRLEAAENEGDPEVLLRLEEVYDPIFPTAGDIPKDSALAAQYCLKAARLGYAPAQSRLIRIYATGAGVPRNYFSAWEWLLRFLWP